MMDPVAKSDLPRLAISGLVKTYDQQMVLDHVDLTLYGGEICLLIGANGVGKTTLLRILATLARPDAGKIYYDPLEEDDLPYRRRIGYVGHHVMLYDDLTAMENLMHYARLYSLSNPAERILQLLEKFGLLLFKDRAVRTYSRGMQQRLSLARVLLHDPSVLLLDEPYTGLDAGASDFLDKKIQALHSPARILLIAVHQPKRLWTLATHIAWLDQGQIAVHLPVTQIKESPALMAYCRVSV
jgi:heme exporter protein A